jgi:Nucleotidyl transferase AbiEii toxin, Type IV TA system
MQLYKETLHPDTKKLFEHIVRWQSMPYHLVWGTALALYLGHRESVDLDFVTYALLTDGDKKRIKQVNPDGYQIVYESDEQLDLFVQGVKLTLFTYRWKPMFPLVTCDGLTMRDLRDIAISKASTIGRRSEIKDYIDLYVILSEGHMTLQELILWSEKKLGGDFSAKLFCKQLLCVDSCEEYAIQILWDRSITKDCMRAYFEELVSQELLR